MVRAFAARGDRVYFTYLRSEKEAERLAGETGAAAVQADAASSAAMTAVIGEAERREGGVDILICNAGTGLVKMLQDTTDEDFRRVMDVNVFGPFCAIRAALPGMFWRRRGCVLTVSSIWGQEGGSCETVYSASKAALIGMTRALAKETAGAGIRVNCLAPGIIDTEMNGHLSREEKEEIAGEIPLGRMGTAEEVAGTAVFLCSDAASYITGQVISVNGGWRV